MAKLKNDFLKKVYEKDLIETRSHYYRTGHKEYIDQDGNAYSETHIVRCKKSEWDYNRTFDFREWDTVAITKDGEHFIRIKGE